MSVGTDDVNPRSGEVKARYAPFPLDRQGADSETPEDNQQHRRSGGGVLKIHKDIKSIENNNNAPCFTPLPINQVLLLTLA